MKRSLVLTITLFIIIPVALNANNIQVLNCDLVNQNTTSGNNHSDNSVNIQFDLSWENSWRTAGAPYNWDAAWVFVKYRVQPSQTWNHVYINQIDHTTGTGTPHNIQVGLMNESLPFDELNNPAVGAFIFRNADGLGTFSANSIELNWKYTLQNVDDNDVIDIMVFAVEMVYVPEGEFYVGDESSSGYFKEGGTASSPFLISSENPITIDNNLGNLFASSAMAIGGTGILPAEYPKGFNGFYCMKYEISQEFYVDFLNSLDLNQSNTLAFTNNINRNGISIAGNIYFTTLPYVVRNYMRWSDAAAISDWSGLRPMTELEFEKACRGHEVPVPNEFSWGTLVNEIATGIVNPGNNNESATPVNANVVAANGTNGPLRTGVFATPLSNREEAGASYYGIMELSGNLEEFVVTVGSSGRSYTGIHGDGFINSSGEANVPFWPNSTTNNNDAVCRRGGAWDLSLLISRVSDRTYANSFNSGRSARYGYRAVRTSPSSPII